MEGVEVLLGILRDAWTTMFGLPTSTLDTIFGTLSSVIGWFATMGAVFGKIFEVLQGLGG